MRRKIHALFILPLILCCSFGYAQQLQVKGKVTDKATNESLVGVSVFAKNATKNGTTTNANGDFTIQVNQGETLVFSYIGYKQYETVVSSPSLNIVLENSSNNLSEVVVVGYGTQKRGSLTSSIATLKGDDVKQAPVANVGNALVGRAPGIIAKQGTGEPGGDGSTIRIRGIATTGNAEPLTIVDGVQRPFTQLDPNEIESYSILKDAASIAPYGMKGANGVILITTKRGKAGKFSFNYDGYMGAQNPTNLPKTVSSFEYATLKNEARANDGIAPLYDQNALQKFQDGSDPDRYPNSQVMDDIIKTGKIQHHNLSFSGGSDKLRFFGGLGYLDQDGNWDNNNFKRVNLRLNVDANLTPTTLLSFDVSGRNEYANYPGQSAAFIMYGLYRIDPTQPYFFSNGLPGGSFQRNIYQDIHSSGYYKNRYNTVSTNLSITQQIPFVKGLSARALVSYDRRDTTTKAWRLPYDYYTLQSDGSYTKAVGGPVTAPSLLQNVVKGEIFTGQLQLNYERAFNKHNVSALAVMEPRLEQVPINFTAGRMNYQIPIDEIFAGSPNTGDWTTGGSSSSATQIGYVFRTSYNYNETYFLEAAGRYDGHYFFAPGKRYAFFPSISGAWRLTKEPFLNDIKWLNELKIRSSYGSSGNLAGGPFQYLSGYALSGGTSWLFGNPYVPVQGVFETIDPNKNITWERANKFNLGLDASFLDSKLGLTVEVFNEIRSGMLINDISLLPAEYGIGIGQINAGRMKNRGIEAELNYQSVLGSDWRLNTGVNFTFARNKVLEIAENETIKNDPLRSQTGKPLGTKFGLKDEGYFQNQAEIDATPYAVGKGLKPGDIKYWDRNGDAQINSLDYVPIGKPNFPEIIYGLNLGLSYKNFELSTLWQGATNMDFYITNEVAWAFFNTTGSFFEHMRDYWTPDNTNARYPRLTQTQTSNNTLVSSHWVEDMSYLRLKTAQLSYTFKQDFLKKAGLSSVRLYAAAQNPLTFSKFKYLDPETTSGSGQQYVQQKVFTLGLNVGF